MNAIWTATVVVGPLDLVFGTTLGYASRRFVAEDDPVVKKIDEILPRSQYGQCGCLDYRLYAEAISHSDERISRRVLGGEAMMLKIAKLSNVEPQPLDGKVQELTPARMVVVIDENNCTSCTKYTQVCPVDAIAGAIHAVHTVMSGLCTGRNSCANPYPTYRISLQLVAETPDPWKRGLNTTPVHIISVEHHA